MIRETVGQMYGNVRGLQSAPDPDVRTGDLLAFVARMGALRAVAIAKGVPRGFVEPSVRLRSRAHISFGARVRLGRQVSIDGLSQLGVALSDGVTVDDFAIIRGSGVIRHLGVGVQIGKHTSIGAHNFLHGGGGIVIGANCLLGPYVSVFSENHQFSDPSIPIREQGELRSRVTIGDNVWIGAQSVLLAGVNVGSNSIIGAGSVVNSSVDPDSIYVGSPARKVGER